MKILAINPGHDAGACIFEDFDLVAYAKEERLNRIKSWGYEIPWLSLKELWSKCPPDEIDCLVMLRASIPTSCYKNLSHRPLHYRALYHINKLLGREKRLSIDAQMKASGKAENELIDFGKLRRLFGLRPDCEVLFSNHHLSHALPAIFYSPRINQGISYTADGVGDFSCYSLYRFDQENFDEVIGGDESIYQSTGTLNSMGRFYSRVTRAAGYKSNRHEGKITGLAAYGKPLLLEELRGKYFLDEKGQVQTSFKNYQEAEDYIFDYARTMEMKDIASSAQCFLEEIMLQAVQCHRTRAGAHFVGLSGGVFANVRANQVIAESEGVDEVFIYPAMGDEGLAVGAALDICRRKWGWKEFMSKRRDLGMIYYGEEFSQRQIAHAAEGFEIEEPENMAREVACRINENKICALFTKGMEYGPRALGARSILATPKDKNINKTLNERLTRTEFMPFAPVVRAERLTEVFKCPPQSERATKYMTITCHVQDQWRDKIPAVVHVDGTARPQSIERHDNPLYYDIIEQFEEVSGLPCLINTSFNAHEEPIINTPQEALRALAQRRIDYLVTDEMIISRKES